MGLGLSHDDVSSLESSLQEDQAETGEKTLGCRTLEWIKSAAIAAGHGGVKIAAHVAEEALKQAVKQYLGP